MTVDKFFSGYAESRRIFDSLCAAILALGDVQVRVTKSQVAFRHRKPFAWAWIPHKYLGRGHAPLVLSLSFKTRNRSKRWKQVVEPAPGRFMHHLELQAESDIDDQVRGWLRKACESASD